MASNIKKNHKKWFDALREVALIKEFSGKCWLSPDGEIYGNAGMDIKDCNVFHNKLLKQAGIPTKDKFMEKTGTVRIHADNRKLPDTFLGIETSKKLTEEQLDVLEDHIRRYRLTLDELAFDDNTENLSAFNQLKDRIPHIWNQSDFARRYQKMHQTDDDGWIPRMERGLSIHNSKVIEKMVRNENGS